MIQNRNESQAVNRIMNKREMIFDELKKRGSRITSQRKLIIDIILEDTCTCCKEIYYQANQKDFSIGIATVYRMVKTLEEIGAIDRKNLYRIDCEYDCKMYEGCSIVLKSNQTLELTIDDWKSALLLGLREKGVITDDEIDFVIMRKPNCMKGLCVDD